MSCHFWNTLTFYSCLHKTWLESARSWAHQIRLQPPYSSIVWTVIPFTSFIFPRVLSLACVHNTTWLDHLAADKDILYSWLLERDMVVMVCCHYQRFWLRHKYWQNLDQPHSTNGRIIIGKKNHNHVIRFHVVTQLEEIQRKQQPSPFPNSPKVMQPKINNYKQWLWHCSW